MDYYREKTSTFFTRVAYGRGRKQDPATVSPPKTIGSPTLQTSLIVKLPDELILSILSPNWGPDPRYTDRYARFRTQRGLVVDYHRRRTWSLRPLSLTCRAMRLRLIPWIWEHLEMPRTDGGDPGGTFVKRLNSITNASLADTFLASSVKFMTVDFPWHGSRFPPFIECLESLPNLHTLEIGWTDDLITAPLKDALKRAEFPQIRTLILPPVAYPLLRHCRGVEDVVYVVRYQIVLPNGLLRCLPSNRDSKIKRLTIPLATWDNLSRFAAACPGLTELTVIYSFPEDAQPTETGIILDPAGRARCAISELAIACRALPDFDTFQIARFPADLPCPVCWHGQVSHCNHTKGRWEGALKKEVKDLGERAMVCLKEPRTGCREGEGRRTTVRVIEFVLGSPSGRFEEYEVKEIDSSNP